MQPRTGMLYQQTAGIIEISCTTAVDNIKPNLHEHSGVQFIWLENFSGDLQSDHSINQVTSSDICIIGQKLPHRLLCRSSQIFAVNFLLDKDYFKERLNQVQGQGMFSKKCDLLITNIESIHNLNIFHVNKYEQDALKHVTSSILQECRGLREGYEIILEGMIQEFLVRLLRSIPNHLVEGWTTVMDVCQYLDENMAKPFDLTHIADEFGFNKSHLCRLFRKIQNMTMYEYLVHVRCSRALEMMQDKNRSITEISQNVGFSDYAQFWRCFKQYTGVSPNKYRCTDQKVQLDQIG